MLCSPQPATAMHSLHPRRLARRPPRRALALAPVGRRWLCVPAESSPTLRPTCLEARGAAELEGQGREQRRIIFFEQLDRGQTSASAIPSSVIRPEGKRWGVAAEGRAGCRGRTRGERGPAVGVTDPLGEWTDAEMWEKEACSHALWWMTHCIVRNDGIRGSLWMGGGLDGRCKRGGFFLTKAGINSTVQCGSPTGPRRCEEIMYAHIASMPPHPPPWQTTREMDGQRKYVYIPGIPHSTETSPTARACVCEVCALRYAGREICLFLKVQTESLLHRRSDQPTVRVTPMPAPSRMYRIARETQRRTV